MTPGLQYQLWEKWYQTRIWLYDKTNELAKFRMQMIRPSIILSGIGGFLLTSPLLMFSGLPNNGEERFSFILLWFFASAALFVLGLMVFGTGWISWPKKPEQPKFRLPTEGEETAEEIDRWIRYRTRMQNKSKH